MNVIECREVTKKYKRKKAIHPLSFSIEENKMVGLIGRNGAGKTTLLKILAGFLKESSGEVKVFSKRPFNNLVVSANTIFIDDQINFPSSFTLIDILQQGERFYENWDKELAHRLFAYFNLESRRSHGNLSKGKKSTFNIIVGLAARCPLTIFDEPTTGMDASVRKDFYRALLKDYITHPRTIILSTHHLEEAEDILEEVLLIKEGEKYLHLPMDNLKERLVGLTGKIDIVYPWIINRDILHTRKIGQEEVYLALKNNFTVNEQEKMKLSGVCISPVSANDACIYMTSEEKGSIDDVFNRE
ncbi:ABC transporter ATP-binding protein [Alteribacillus bidgolensis]|uniref:ABC-2 type transport system ATP-binding protein n=1 Tax=Alteribacillus bidgolensis TaxID=930129 RepID=A0A1G8E093_9BACI|nr:ABC transporter ATP-binding protein [Alteribacillus bidgolensis]SDH63285.1 ABC-2 type transport system ATP-binding protein [Alteribacillus bidgolensis]